MKIKFATEFGLKCSVTLVIDLPLLKYETEIHKHIPRNSLDRKCEYNTPKKS